MGKSEDAGGAKRKVTEVVRLRRLPRTDSASASVCWEHDVLFFIVLVRRSDGALTFIDVPDELSEPLRRFSVAAVIEHADALRAVVLEALPMVEFQIDGEVGSTAVRDGATPAVLGMVRHFKEGSFGVDIGEFELAVSPPWLM